VDGCTWFVVVFLWTFGKGLEVWVESVADVRVTGSSGPGFQSLTIGSARFAYDLVRTLTIGTQITRSTLAW